MRTPNILALLFSVILFVTLNAHSFVFGQEDKKESVTTVSEVIKEEVETKPLPIEQQAYRVKVILNFSESIFNTPEQRTHVSNQISDELRRLFGAIWDYEIETKLDHSQFPALLTDSQNQKLNSWYQSHISDEDTLDELHKCFVIRIRSDQKYRVVSAREWDARSQTWSPIVNSRFLESNWMVSEIGKQIERVFRPITLVVRDRIEGNPSSKNVYLRLQAGELSSPSEAVQQLVPGDIMSPILLYLGRSQGANKPREIRKRQVIDWTYLVVESVDNGRVVCRPFSTFRVPISKPQTRLKTMALRIRPWHESSKIKLVRRNSSQGIGSLVVRISERNSETDKYEIQDSLISDRDGWIEIPANTNHSAALKRLNIVSGESLIARVPYLLGEKDKIILQLPDDRIRLKVEGQLTRLRNELTELVAKRAVLIHRIKTLAKQEKWESVDTLVKEDLEKIPDAEEFLIQVNAIRVPAVDAAKKQRDRGAEIRIVSLCQKAEDLIKRYLKDDKKSFLLQELKELREISENKS